MRVMVLEDDTRLCQAFAGKLRADGHAVDQVGTLRAARLAIIDTAYDCLVLDRMVSDGDSLDIVIDMQGSDEPPAMLCVSAFGGADERMAALEAGADDYLTKPARLDELAIRVRKLWVRRTSTVRGPDRLGRVVVDRNRKAVTMDGEAVHLTPTQYAVLDHLVAHRDRMVTTQELLDHCWDANRDLLANPLHSQICRLRRRFRGALSFDLVRGEGYVLRVDDEDATHQSVDV